MYSYTYSNSCFRGALEDWSLVVQTRIHLFVGLKPDDF